MAAGPYRAEFGAIHHEGTAGFLFTVSGPPDHAAEVAAGLNCLDLVADHANFHAVDLEQCAVVVDSAPLAKAMTDAAAFLRSLTARAAGSGEG